MKIGRDILLATAIGLIGGTISYMVTYSDRPGYYEETGYPPSMLTLQAVGTAVGTALFAFLVVLTVDTFWLAPKRKQDPE